MPGYWFAGVMFLALLHSSVSISLGCTDRSFYCVSGFWSFPWNCSYVRFTKFKSCMTLVEVLPSQLLSCLTRNSKEFVNFVHLACRLSRSIWAWLLEVCFHQVHLFLLSFWRLFRMLFKAYRLITYYGYFIAVQESWLVTNIVVYLDTAKTLPFNVGCITGVRMGLQRIH